MVKKPNKISRFWQELKRRKVIHVIVVYATVSYVLTELVDIIQEPLQLPAWVLPVVIVLLVVGFPIAIIFSWIYDISSKGITKTEKEVPEDRTFKFENSIAVLPFQDMSAAKDQEYFCDGIAEEIINALAHVSSLKVIARTSAFAFKNQNLEIREIGEKLKVGAVLEGSIRKDGNRLRITVQLIKTDDNFHIWSERYDRRLQDIFAIQDEIAMAIVDNLKIKLLGEERTAVLKRYTDDIEVYNLYLKALSHIQLVTPEGFEKAIEYIRQVLQKNPQFVPGFTALGRIYALSAFFGEIPPNKGYPKAKAYAEKALDMDNTAPGAHYIMGMISTYYNWDWEAGEHHLKYALKLNPNLGWIYISYANLLTLIGRHTEAIEHAKKAVELDPLSGYFSAMLGIHYTYARQFENAINHLKETITMFPKFYMGHWYSGIAYHSMLKMDKAIKKFRKAVELSNEAPMAVAFLAGALLETGNNEEADSLIESLMERSDKEYVPANCFTGYFMLKDDHDQLYRCLEKAVQEHDVYLPFNIICPIKHYRIPNEPRYAELMKKAGLQQIFQNEET